MPSILLYAVACSQIVVLYFLAAPLYFQLTRLTFLGKNPDWLAAHPEFARRHRPPRRMIFVARALGLGWLAWFGARLLAAGTAPDPWLLLYAPMLLWLLLEASYALLGWQRIYRAIPLPARRRAQLAPRRLSDALDPRLLYPAFFVLAAQLGLYLAAWQRGAINAGLLGWRLATLALCLGGWGWMLAYYLRRKPRLADEQFGPRYRRLEIIETVLCLYALCALSGWMLAQDAFGVPPLAHAVLLTGASVLLQALVLAGPRYGSLQSLFAAASASTLTENP